MKILLINYHYFLHGGPDRYFFSIKRLLERDGHTVVPFSFDYDETHETPYRRYFPDPISGRGTFLLENLDLSLSRKLAYGVKMFVNREVERKFIRVMEREEPDIVCSIYLSSSFLPKILHIAKSRFGVPVVYRLSDYHMFCPSYLFYRDGRVCTECADRPRSAIRHRCVQGSSLASALRVLQMKHIRANGWYDSIDAFVCPSRLMQKQLVDGGFPKGKVLWVPTSAPDLQGPVKNGRATCILYFGKVTREKGVEVLIDAYNAVRLPRLPLKLVGYCSPEYRNVLASRLDDRHRASVTIAPPMDSEELWQTLRDSAFVVHPAIWLENMPNTLIEAFSAGKPVIASDIGSLPELVDNDRNGLLVPPGDVGKLAEAMERMSVETDLAAMGANAYRRYLDNHTEEMHAARFQAILRNLMNSRPSGPPNDL